MLAYLVVILCFFGVPAFFIGLAFWYLLAPAKPTLAAGNEAASSHFD
jgi:hypothetical protein